jgi:hypothetical protein
MLIFMIRTLESVLIFPPFSFLCDVLVRHLLNFETEDGLRSTTTILTLRP